MASFKFSFQNACLMKTAKFSHLMSTRANGFQLATER